MGLKLERGGGGLSFTSTLLISSLLLLSLVLACETISFSASRGVL